MLLLTTLDESIESEAATWADTLCHAPADTKFKLPRKPPPREVPHAVIIDGRSCSTRGRRCNPRLLGRLASHDNGRCHSARSPDRIDDRRKLVGGWTGDLENEAVLTGRADDFCSASARLAT
jgi:hypothetical protein